jgi:hypothetical protein
MVIVNLLYARIRDDIPTNLLNSIGSFENLSLQWFMIGRKDCSNSSTAVVAAAIAQSLPVDGSQVPSDCFLLHSLSLTIFLQTPKASGIARRHMFGILASSRELALCIDARCEGIPKFSNIAVSRMKSMRGQMRSIGQITFAVGLDLLKPA